MSGPGAGAAGAAWWLRRAGVAAQLGRRGEVERSCAQALALAPDAGDAWALRAWLACDEATASPAALRAVALAGLAVAPSHPYLHYALGVAALRLGALDEARGALARACSLDASCARLRARYARVLARAGERALALREARRAAVERAARCEGAGSALPPPSRWEGPPVDVLGDAVRALLAAGALAEAEAWSERLLRLAPDEPWAHGHRARVHAARGAHGLAHACARRGLARAPNDRALAQLCERAERALAQGAAAEASSS